MKKQRFLKNKIKFLLLFTIFSVLASVLFIFYKEPIKVEGYNTQNGLQEFLYDINEQPSFILTNFQDGGYEISSAVTGEPIEFSRINSLPYNNDGKKYYGGPFAYIEKRNDQFYAIQATANDGDNTQTKTGMSKKFDRRNLIKSSADGISNARYISNQDYFSYNLQYGANSHNTCGSVATQILLSYTNYYFDRRIVSPNYLNGAWKSSNNGDRFDRNNYNFPSQDPNACSDPTSKNEYILMTNNDFYNHIISINEPGALQCVDTITTTVVNNDGTTTVTIEVRNINGDEIAEKVVETHETKSGERNHVEREHSHSGSYMSDVKRGVQTVLNNSIGSGNYTLNDGGRAIGMSKNEYAEIRNEIKSNRPVILLTNSFLGGPNHFTVAYGYADYTYPGKDEAFSGFITDFGWGSESHNVWLNSSWCAQYLSVQTKHEHNYNIDTGKNFSGYKREVRCGECGHRTLKDIYSVDDEGVLTVNYPLSGAVTIPYRVGDKTVAKIGEASFMDNRNITSVSISNGINEISDNAFNGCVSLNSVSLPSSLRKIGTEAFYNCSQMKVVIIPEYVNTVEVAAFDRRYIQKIFYKGSESGFRNIENHQIFYEENVYYYSGRKPAYGAHYWRYTSGLPEIWKSIKVTSVTPNGSLNQETTTQITFTFSEDPGNLRASDFAFSDGEATYIQGSGNTRIVGISGFNLRNTRSVSVKITPQSEYCFVDEYNNSTIYVKLTPIIYLDKDKDYFSGNFGDDYVDEHIFTETTTLPKAHKVARRLAAWYLKDEDGNYTAIESLSEDFHAESVTVYAEWKSDLNMDYFDGTPLEIVYNMRDDKMRAPDVFCGTGDVSQSDLSYMLRESLFPALSRLSIGGYSYELNFDLIRSHELNGNVLTIELFDDYKFSDGSMLRAECFEAYYLLVRSFYADEELPAPWSFISSVTSEDFELQIEFIDNNLNISYFLHEFRAYSTSWVSHDPTHGPTAATSANEANNFCLEGYFPSYGKYKISDYNNYDEICLTANPYYARADETDAPDVNIKIMNTTAESVIRWQTGEYDAYFNMIENDVDGFVDNSESVFHKYDSRVRMLLGVVKNSDFFEQYDEDFICENFLPILFRMIDFNRIAEAFKNSVKEKSSWATDVLIKEFMGDFSEIMVPIMLSPSEGRRMLEDLTGIPKTHMLNFKLFVPSNDICRKIAEIIQENFHEAYISMDLVYGENIEEVIECDLCLFPYDYSGGNLFGKDVLSSDYLKYIFFPRSSQNAELDSIESEYYSESGITERNFFAGELLRIMERYCYKINHIPKGYLSSDDFHNLIYGNVRLLVY